jgi:D-serine deaminase-like pyridoxal phosphate-dependent protein
MTPFTVANETSIPSPALLVYREKVDANLALMLKIAGGPARLRPHVKTHKLAPLVRRQIELGIKKFKAATLAEAAMCASAGAPDVLVAYPLAGPAITGICELAKQYPSTKFSALADSSQAIRGLSVAARIAGIRLPVFLDIDCGMHRTGVTVDRAAALYRLITESPALIAAGLHAYDGHIHDPSPETRRAECEAAFDAVTGLRTALNAPVLIAGGSPTFPFHATCTDRECSPGTPVLWDWGYGEKFADLPFEIAAALLTRVVSKPSMNHLTLDLGYKAVAAENPLAMRVKFPEIPDANIVMHSEEHIVIETARAKEFHIGQPLHALPKHICPTVALYDEVWHVEHGVATGRWSVARGRL